MSQMEPTHKDCGSKSCPHGEAHEHTEFCDVPGTCQWDPTCRCVSVFRGELISLLRNLYGANYTVEDIAGDIMALLEAKGVCL